MKRHQIVNAWTQSRSTLSRRLKLVGLAALLGCSWLHSCAAQEADFNLPQSVDQSWTVELLAHEPDLVTPTALTVDGEGKIYVIECHTHFRPDDYQGPLTDRIRVLHDSDGNGSIDQITTFFDGSTATMGLYWEEAGSLLVATRNDLFRLQDTDGDGVADQRTDLAKLETQGNYPHNGLSGLAIDATGHILVGFGENLGERYSFIGADGSRITGGGEGGNIFRLKSDGSQVERWATGFWNPFQLTVDDFGRVFAVDNDPDWRPPCRLLHVVQGGDYGYRFALGRRGTHPFTAWFGDSPDRLGMVAGTGEAPSGMVAYRGGKLAPADEGALLVTSWGLHTLERYRLIRQGGSFSSQAEIRIKGGEDYRPVGLAIAPNGALIASDWVKRSYPLHGHGRVWRHLGTEPLETSQAGQEPWQVLNASDQRAAIQSALASLLTKDADLETLRSWVLNPKVEAWRRAQAVQALYRAGRMDQDLVLAVVRDAGSEDLCVLIAPYAAELGVSFNDLIAAYQAGDLSIDGMNEEVLAEWTRRVTTEADFDALRSQLDREEPFVRQATIFALSRVASNSQQCLPLPNDPETVRVALANVLARRDDASARTSVAQLMADPSPAVRWVALRWIAESGLVEQREAVERELRREALGPKQFEAVLATLEQLNGRSGAAFEGAQLSLLESIIKGRNNEPGSVIAMALRHLDRAARRDRVEQPPAGLSLESLRFLLNHASTEVREEAVRLLALWHTGNEVQQSLMVTAADEQQPESVRRAALAGLQDVNSILLFVAQGGPLQDDAIRSLRGRELTAEQRATLNQTEVAARSREALDRLTGSVDDQRPLTRDGVDWIKWIEEGEIGDAERGERWFFHAALARCSSCHAVAGRGAAIGPDLSVAGEMGRIRLIESIVDPSREMAPRYTPWLIETLDGSVQAGLLETERGEMQYYVDSQGKTFAVDFDDVAARTASPHSIMPDDLVSALTRDEIADLLAYLESLKE